MLLIGGMKMENEKTLTTDFGKPVECDFASLTAGPYGPTLLEDAYLREKIAHFAQEATLPRAMHTKGAGAHGVFRVTNDVTAYTCADFLSQVGKETPIFTRFSQAVGGRESMDTTRNIRGWAIKFYTEEGNYDLLGITVPAFFISDIMKFPDFVHSLQGLPQNDLKTPNTSWDFFSLNPETIHAVTLFFTDRATPASYRNINIFGPNTFLWYNKQGERFLVKYHLMTKQGIKNMTIEEATKIGGENPDYLRQDLFDALERREYPEWDFCVQIMPEKDALSYEYDPYDPTQVWLKKDYPLIKVGEIRLTRNPENYFVEVEQAAFSISNFVPGINASNDKLLQGRLFVYQNAQDHRLGINKNQIPINRPKYKPFNFERDGIMNVSDNGGSSPNYDPNSYEKVAPYKRCPLPQQEVAGKTGRYIKTNHEKTFEQAGMLYRRVLSEEDRNHLIHNIVLTMQQVPCRIQYRQTALFYLADPDYGTRVAQAIGLDIQKVKQLAAMSQKERIMTTQNW